MNERGIQNGCKISLKQLKLMLYLKEQVVNVHVLLQGELGWEFYMDQQHMKTVYEALLQAGEPHGVGDVGVYAVGTLRLEKGFRMWGAEV